LFLLAPTSTGQKTESADPQTEIETNGKSSNGLPSIVPLGKPPKYPCFRNRSIGPKIDERIKELSTTKPGNPRD